MMQFPFPPPKTLVSMIPLLQHRHHHHHHQMKIHGTRVRNQEPSTRTNMLACFMPHSLTSSMKLGWIEAALMAGAKDVGLSPSIVGSLSRKEAALVEFFMDDCLQRLIDKIDTDETLKKLSPSDCISKLIKFRLQMQAPYVSIWPEVLSIQVRLYDISAQRRPVLSIDFHETPIKALAEDIDGNTIYLGNGSGDTASVDIRTGKMLGFFTGKCSESIRSVVRHPELPVVASCGLDGYLRLWDTKTMKLLSSVFLKQHILHVLFYSNFIVEDIPKEADSLPSKEQTVKEITDGEEIEATPLKRKKIF